MVGFLDEGLLAIIRLEEVADLVVSVVGFLDEGLLASFTGVFTLRDITSFSGWIFR